MASSIYDLLDERAAALKFGVLRVELKVSGGKVVMVEDLEAPRMRWTLEDVRKKDTLIA